MTLDLAQMRAVAPDVSWERFKSLEVLTVDSGVCVLFHA